MSKFVDDIIQEHLTKNDSLSHYDHIDGHVRMQVELLRRYAHALEEACQIHGVLGDTAEKLIRTMILGSLPSGVDVYARMQTESAFHEHLSQGAMPPIVLSDEKFGGGYAGG